MSGRTKTENINPRRVLGRVSNEEFVGRTAELQEIVRHAAGEADARGLLLLLAPSAGVSELLRQAYDELFNKRSEIVPVYFAFTRSDKTAAAAAVQFLNTFLLQYVAYRRDDPLLLNATLTVNELLELSLPADEEWLRRLVEGVERERATGDELSLIRSCLGAPQRLGPRAPKVFVMIDGVQLADGLEGNVSLGTELIQMLFRSDTRFALAGLRRQILDAVHSLHCDLENIDVIRLERLSDNEARSLVDHIARRQGVAINEQTRDLIVQQFAASPFFITALIRAARENKLPLTSYLNCQKTYVDELMGGRINRHFSSLLEEIAPQAGTRRALIKLLHESASGDATKAPVETWRKRLGIGSEELNEIMRSLHSHELASWNSGFVETGDGSAVWSDYLRAHYRVEVSGEPRALVVADTLVETLERAPHTMARHYRREAALGLRDLLSRFDCQRVSASLLHHDRFSRAYKGLDAEEINVGLDAEADLIRLPQIVHAASCAAFHPSIQGACEDEHCAIGHGFDAGNYLESNKVVWVAAEIDSKVEAGRGITEVWCNRLATFARTCGFRRVRLWLISPHGFSAEACELLSEREAYGSNRQQLEFLTARLGADLSGSEGSESAPDEFEMVIPIGEETELIAAQTVEHIARRINFRPEAINQIKTAVIEACINAAEHSLSPDRKIYQRFRVESDRLVVTVSSRGVVPPEVNGDNVGVQLDLSSEATSRKRRGWGLKLIRTLMDEVEFERVDDGTRLRMTKYLHK